MGFQNFVNIVWMYCLKRVYEESYMYSKQDLSYVKCVKISKINWFTESKLFIMYNPQSTCIYQIPGASCAEL